MVGAQIGVLGNAAAELAKHHHRNILPAPEPGHVGEERGNVVRDVGQETRVVVGLVDMGVEGIVRI